MSDKSKLSIIKSVSKSELQGLMDSHSSKRDVVKTLFSITDNPHNTYVKYLTNMIKIHDIDLTIFNQNHTESRASQMKTLRATRTVTNINDILKSNTNYDSTHVKKRCFDAKLLHNVCSKCGCGDMWMNESITLQLDHINGDNTDNRLENLRILCPNCHSQTRTFCSRNRT